MTKSSVRLALLGCILLILTICCVWATDHPAYKALKNYLGSSPDLQARIGSIRIFHQTCFDTYQSFSDASGAAISPPQADVGVVIIGTKGRGNIYARLTDNNNIWNIDLLNINNEMIFDNDKHRMDQKCISRTSSAIIIF